MEVENPWKFHPRHLINTANVSLRNLQMSFRPLEEVRNFTERNGKRRQVEMVQVRPYLGENLEEPEQ
jgi:hypothetical protein